MEMMLKKLEKHKQSNVDSVMMDDKQQKIEREIHADDSNVTVLQKEAAAHPKVYGDIRVINDKLYNNKRLKKIDTIEVIDELTRNTASIDYVGGKYYVYENGQIVREFYAGGKKRLEEVSYIPEDKVGGAKSLDSFLAGTQYEFIEWVSPQGAVKKLAVRGGKRVVTDVAKHVVEKDIKGDVKKKPSKGSVNSKWWHPGYVDNLSSSQTVIGIKNSPKGLSTLGSSTRQNALDAGKGWVGQGAEKMYDKAGNFLGYKSVDKMRAFRLQYKPKEKMWRANFTENEITVVGSKTELRNVHVDILD